MAIHFDPPTIWTIQTHLDCTQWYNKVINVKNSETNIYE